ncbi:Transposon TX1 uncharacterized 149 kDa protein [Linum grandiflorum]
MQEEFRRAMFDMEPDKAPGPDGFNPGFYQRMWNDIGGDVTTACQTWLMEARIPIDIQATIVLPKLPTPETMQDLRHISLCNVLYRLVAKVLANLLRRVMQRIIGAEQSAFIRGRSIYDNVLIAFETLHAMKTKQRTLTHRIAVTFSSSPNPDDYKCHYSPRHAFDTYLL